MKTFSYLSFLLLYVLGLFLLLDFFFKFQNATFDNTYYSVLFPFLGLFLIGIYASLPKFVTKISKSSYISNEKLKWFVLLISLIILSLIILIKFNVYQNVLVTILIFIGYVLSLITGYKLVRFINKNIE
ncbi:hypothetical protein [Gottfriedia acidiceleris]|uniref:hypothetical protein n=1 Tax=Gottfriedia acidiceleris TaxID=371036 RepID=UPI002FFE19AA